MYVKCTIALHIHSSIHLHSVELICDQDLIELYLPAYSDVKDLKLAMASLGFSATQQEEDKKGGF